MTSPIRFSAAGWRRVIRGVMAAILSAFANAAVAQGGEPTSSDIGALKKLAFEELFNIEITTISRRPERLVDVASAIQVITTEEIRGRAAGIRSAPAARAGNHRD